MRLVIAISFLFLFTTASATNYYISSTGNNSDDGKSPAKAWQTLAKLNASFGLIASGDSVLLNRGDKFYGSIIVGRAGVHFGYYGTGALPVVTGATTLSSWVATGGGKYYSSITIDTTINLLTIDGNPQRMARYPNEDTANAGYLVYNTVAGNLGRKIRSVIAGSWIGKKMIVRATDWRLEKVIINDQNSDTVSFSMWYNLNNGGINGYDSTRNGFGYFFVDDTTFLDKFGEWTYDPKTSRMYVYFGSNNPNTYTVQVPTVDTLFNNFTYSNTTVENIRFEYGGLYGVYATTAQNVFINGNEFNNMGAQAIGCFRLYNGSVISNNDINNCMQCGIYDRSSPLPYTGLTITGNRIDSIGMFAGMGSFNQADYLGISSYVFDNSEVSYNDISFTGVDGIAWQGSDALIFRNRVRGFCAVGQDHGGIYSYWDVSNHGDDVYFHDRYVIENFVSDGIGAPGGTNTNVRRVSGIYNDGRTSNVVDSGNVVYNDPRAGFTNNIEDSVSIINNLIVMPDTTGTEASRAIQFQQNSVDTIRHLTITGNSCYLFKTTQSQIYYTIGSLAGSMQTNLRAIGTINSNFYNMTTQTAWDIEYYNPSFNFSTNNLSNWRILSNYDLLSLSVPNVSKDSTVLYPNWSPNPITKTLTAKYISPQGIVSEGVITIQPYTAYFGIYYSPSVVSSNYILTRKIFKNANQ